MSLYRMTRRIKMRGAVSESERALAWQRSCLSPRRGIWGAGLAAVPEVRTSTFGQDMLRMSKLARRLTHLSAKLRTLAFPH